MSYVQLLRCCTARGSGTWFSGICPTKVRARKSSLSLSGLTWKNLIYYTLGVQSLEDGLYWVLLFTLTTSFPWEMNWEPLLLLMLLSRIGELLYISTIVWVLRTPNAGRNSHFQCFLLQIYNRELYLKRKSYLLCGLTGWCLTGLCLYINRQTPCIKFLLNKVCQANKHSP